MLPDNGNSMLLVPRI